MWEVNENILDTVETQRTPEAEASDDIGVVFRKDSFERDFQLNPTVVVTPKDTEANGGINLAPKERSATKEVRDQRFKLR